MIENISDQLGGFMEEVAVEVEKLEKKYNLTKGQALKVADIATKDILADEFHHINFKLKDMCESINEITDAIYKLDLN